MNWRSYAKGVVWKLLTLLARPLGDRASILMYHSVGEDNASFTVSAAVFEEQLRYLTKHDFSIVPLSELVTRLEQGRLIAKTICLTFDDGYRNNYEVAFPLLQRYGIPASIFLTTGLLGQSLTNSEGVSLPLMTEAQVREMQGSGLIEFFPHGVTHRKLHKLSTTEVEKEITMSRAAVQALTHTAADIFAFPSGRYTDATLDAVRHAGFSAAVTVTGGSIGANAHLLELPRNSIDSSTTFSQFRGKLSRAIDWYTLLKLMANRTHSHRYE